MNEKEVMISVIHEVVREYTATNRCTDDTGKCCYENESGDHCAVGRFLSSEGLGLAQELERDEDCSAFTTLYSEYEARDKNYKLFKEGYNDLPTYFWTQIQNLHDNSRNWFDDGLSDKGKLALKMIQRDFELLINGG